MVVPLLRPEDPNAAKNEYTAIRQKHEENRYAEMRPEELAALAAKYKDNPAIQDAIRKLKADMQSRDSQGGLFDQTSSAAQSAGDSLQQAQHKAGEVGATAVGILTELPVKSVYDYLTDKDATRTTLAADLATDKASGLAQDFAVSAGEKYKTAFDLADPALVEKLGGLKGVVGKVAVVPDLIDAWKAGNEGDQHLINYAAQQSQVNAAGGVSIYATRWNDARNQSYTDSAQLYRLIQQEEARKQAAP